VVAGDAVMNRSSDSDEPLEQWKEDYNRDGTASLEPRSQLSVAAYHRPAAAGRAVASRDPAGRSFADIADWGTYTYVDGMIAPVSADDTGP
jgi:hypothetical protein